MKKILFVVNTLGRAGAETALLEMLKRLRGQQIDGQALELFLYVITAQGEMRSQLPPYVKLLNKHYHSQSVLTGKGKAVLARRAAGRGVYAKRRLCGKNALCGGSAVCGKKDRKRKQAPGRQTAVACSLGRRQKV